MSRSEQALVLIMRISAAVLLIALVPAVMPFAWMEDIHRHLGMGELPARPIVGYLTRSLSALYAVHGALLFFVSLDVRRFLPVVKCLAVLKILFGIGMFALDLAVGMPPFWTGCEGPILVGVGSVFLWLSGRIREVPAMSPPQVRQ